MAASLPPAWTPATLADAADENLVVHATWIAQQLPTARVEPAPDLVLVDSGLPCDTFNFVCRARLTPATAAARVHDALAFFARSGHPFSWWLSPGSTPDDLPCLLQKAGLEPAETEQAMALDLDALPEPPSRPPGFEVRRVRTATDLQAFAALSAANWSPPDPHVVWFYELAAPALLRPDAPQWLYLGLLNDRPVATAELALGGGVVGLYNIATAFASRGQGIGTAMTYEPLQAARGAGHHTAILQAAPDGIRIYARLGFIVTGTITEFKPAPVERAA